MLRQELSFGVCGACKGCLQRLQKIASSRFSVVQYAHFFISQRSLSDSANAT
jgi:hypothetical protein